MNPASTILAFCAACFLIVCGVNVGSYNAGHARGYASGFADGVASVKKSRACTQSLKEAKADVDALIGLHRIPTNIVCLPLPQPAREGDTLEAVTFRDVIAPNGWHSLPVVDACKDPSGMCPDPMPRAVYACDNTGACGGAPPLGPVRTLPTRTYRVTVPPPGAWVPTCIRAERIHGQPVGTDCR